MSDPVNFTFKAVAFIESAAKYRYELPRQSVFAASCAFLRWSEKIYAECAEDLKGFDRIWLVWVFDRNENNKFHPKVRVPVPAEKNSYSVFATRSPYRPNPVGISAVELLEITPDGLRLGGCDLLDGTAVLDVKPYIPEVDSFPDSKAGWRDNIDKKSYQIFWGDNAAKQADFILENGNFDLRNFAHTQLSYRPADKTRKRLEMLTETEYILHFRTWKIHFEIAEEKKEIYIINISSNYSTADLAPDTPDRYSDKELHRLFNANFNQTDKVPNAD